MPSRTPRVLSMRHGVVTRGRSLTVDVADIHRGGRAGGHCPRIVLDRAGRVRCVEGLWRDES